MEGGQSSSGFPFDFPGGSADTGGSSSGVFIPATGPSANPAAAFLPGVTTPASYTGGMHIGAQQPLPQPPSSSPSTYRRGPGRPRKDGSGFTRQNSRPSSGRARVKAYLVSGGRMGRVSGGGRSSSSPSTSSPSTPGWDPLDPLNEGLDPVMAANQATADRCAFCYLTSTSTLGQGDLSTHPPSPDFTPAPRPPPPPSVEHKDPAPSPSFRRPRTKGELSALFHRNEPFDEIEIIGLPEDITVADVFSPSSGECMAHFCCAAWSEGVVQAENLLQNVDKAVCQGMSQRCGGCDKTGASIQCKAEGCGRYYHYPCASAYGGFLDVQCLLFLCPDHASTVNDLEDNIKTAAACEKCDQIGDLKDQLYCTSCGRHYHGRCLEPLVETRTKVRAGWQCPDCKTCQYCRSAVDDNKMLVCDNCDKGCHMYCMTPQLSTIPKFGWKCKECRQCQDCGARSPGNGPSSRWHLNYTICDSCYQQRNKGLACPICSKAYRQGRQKTMKTCMMCRKSIHFECDPTAAKPGAEPYICPICKSNGPGAVVSPGSLGDDPEEETELLGFMKSQISGDPLSGTESPFSELGPEFGTDMDLDTILGNEDSLQSVSGSESGAPSTSAMRVPNAPQGFHTVSTERHKRQGAGKGVSKKKPPPIRRSRSGKGVGNLALLTGEGPRKRGRPARSMSHSLIASSVSEESVGKEKEKVDEEYIHTVVVASGKDEFTVAQDMCVICGSFGKDSEGQLIACTQCAQCYHTYCANVKLSAVVLRRGWRCLDCTVCEGCGTGADEEHLLLCDECDISFHTYCLSPKLPTIPSGAWRCSWCARCQRCKAGLPQVTSRPGDSHGLCASCQSLSLCPRCNVAYKEGDFMIQCLGCNRWSHGPCEQLETEEALEAAAEKGFHCLNCRHPHPDTHGNVFHYPEGGGVQITMDGVALTQSGLSATTASGVGITPASTITTRQHSHSLPPARQFGHMDAIGDTIDQVTAAVHSGVHEQEGVHGPIKMVPDMFDDGMDETNPRDMSPSGLYVPPYSSRGRGGGRGRRMLNRMGIGGFIVRPVRQRSMVNPNEEQGEAIAEEGKEEDGAAENPFSAQKELPMPGGAPGEADRPVRKRRRRTRRSHLDDTYPDQIRNAFFGQQSLLGAKAAQGVDLDSPKLEEAASAFQPSVATRQQSTELSRMSVEQLKRKEAQEKQMAEDNFMKDAFDGFGLGPQVGMDIDIPENMQSILDTLLTEDARNSDSGTPSNDATAKDDLGSLLGTEFFNDAPQAGPTALPAPTLGVQAQADSLHMGAGAPGPSQSMAPASANLNPVLKQEQGQHMQREFYPRMATETQRMPFPNPVPNRPPMCPPSMPPQPGQDPRKAPQDFGMAPVRPQMMPSNVQQQVQPQMAPIQPQAPPAPPPPAPAPVSGGSDLKTNAIRWEQEEPLGHRATLAPILYVNMVHPDLKERMPDWDTRAKHINKLWRNLSAEDRQKYVLLARDNRAATRQPRPRKMSKTGRQDSTGALTPTGDPAMAMPMHSPHGFHGQHPVAGSAGEAYHHDPSVDPNYARMAAHQQDPMAVYPQKMPAAQGSFHGYPEGNPMAGQDPSQMPGTSGVFKVPQPPGMEGQAGWPGQGSGPAGGQNYQMKQESRQCGFGQQQGQYGQNTEQNTLLADLLEQERMEQSARTDTRPQQSPGGGEGAASALANWAQGAQPTPAQQMAAAAAQVAAEYQPHDEKHAELLSAVDELTKRKTKQEDELSRMRKQKKNLAAKQRQFKRNNQELTPEEKGLLEQLAHSIASWHKQVEQLKKQLKQKAGLLQDYESKHGIAPRPQFVQGVGGEGVPEGPSPILSPSPSLPSQTPTGQIPQFPLSPALIPPRHPQQYPSMRPEGVYPQHQGQHQGYQSPGVPRPPFPPRMYCPPRPGMEGHHSGMMVPSLHEGMGQSGYFGGAAPGMIRPGSPTKKKPRKRRKKAAEGDGSINFGGTDIPRDIFETLHDVVERVSFTVDGRAAHADNSDTILKHLLHASTAAAQPPPEPEPGLSPVQHSPQIPALKRPAMVPTPGALQQQKKRYRKGTKKGSHVYDEYTVFTERVNIELKRLSKLEVQEPRPGLERGVCPIYGISALPDRNDKPMVIEKQMGAVALAFMPDFYLESFGKVPSPTFRSGVSSPGKPSPPSGLLGEKVKEEGLCELIRGRRSPVLEDTSLCFSNLRTRVPHSGRVSPHFRIMMAPPTMRAVPEDPPRELLDQLRVQTTRSNVPVTMTLDAQAAKNMENVMKNLAILLNIDTPIEYQVLDTPPHTPEKGMAKVPLPEPNQVCRSCRSQIKQTIVKRRLAELGLTPTEEGNDEVVFCSQQCYVRFAQDYKTPLTPEDMPDQVKAIKKEPEDVKPIITAAATIGAELGYTGAGIGPPGVPNASIDAIIQDVVGSGPPYQTGVRELTAKVKDLPRPGESGREMVRGPGEQRRWKGQRWMTWNQGIRESFLELQKEFNQMILQLRAVFRPPDLPEDERKCELCGGLGDGEPEGPGRLLNMDAARWIHVNCALWSSEVYETVGGALVNVESAVRRGQNSICVECKQPGATLRCYKLRCESVYHFPCAHKLKCFFMLDKTVFCPEHPMPDPLQRLAVYRRVFVERDENHLIAKLYQQGDAGLVLRVGNLIFHHVGQLLPHQLKSFHTQEYIFPVGYSVTRIYWSAVHSVGSARRVRYQCSIADKDGQPEFVVQYKDIEKEAVALRENSAAEVWGHVLRQVEQFRVNGSQDVLKLFPRYLSGDSLFGFSEPSILKMVESLPGVESILTYNFKYGRSPLMDLPLAVNPSGCARCEPRFRTYIKRSHTLHVGSLMGGPGASARDSAAAAKMSNQLAAFLSLHMDDPYSRFDLDSVSNSTKWNLYRHMKDNWRDQVYLARSKIQGLGLYAKCDIPMNAMIIEYLGEVIRNEVAEKREKLYDQQHRGVYMFRIDTERVVDATMCGGPARYINHSCDPNCSTQLYQKANNEIKIIVLACRPISAGEELTYDYQFDFEDDKNKIPCLCGAPNCRKWMN